MFGVKVGWLILSVVLVLKEFSCAEIKCQFRRGSFHSNGRDGATTLYSYCYLSGATLNDENETLSINTSDNTMRNDKILVLFVEGTKMSYIPNILFTTFPNMEIFWKQGCHNFMPIKPHFLKNANKLKAFVVKNDNFEKLDAELFIEAPNLEYINLKYNQITSIHRHAFNGIFKLKRIYLDNNKISNIHPDTFLHLISLEFLDLLANTCVSKSFQNANKQFIKIEGEIQKSCAYKLTEEEIKRIRKTTKQNKNAINIAKKFANTLKDKQEEHEIKFVNLTTTIEKIKNQFGNVLLKVEKMDIEKNAQSEKMENLEKINKNLTSSIEELMEKNDLLEKTLKVVETKITEESQKITATCDRNILLSENKSLKSIHDQKIATDQTLGLIISNGNANLDQNSKICQKEVCDLEAKMQAIDEGFERRLQEIEKENFEHALDSRIPTP